MTKNAFVPDWYEEIPPDESYRSIFKWGDHQAFKHPNHGLYDLMKKTFDLSDNDFLEKQGLGLEPIIGNFPIKMSDEQIIALKGIVGPSNAREKLYDRVKAGYGKGMIDILRLRGKVIENIPDVVLCPKNTSDIEKVVQYCNEEAIPIYVFGGGSSVTRGLEAVKGGVTIDMSMHMNKVIKFNETDQTITVQAGISGPDLEAALNDAPTLFNAQRRYTCGHFPQSFEYSTVGGWVVTRGAGQNSTYYGKIEDIVLSQEYVTPIGKFETHKYPRTATGPDFNQIMMGNEGTFGILTEVTLKVFRHMPANRKYFSYMFRDWENALKAVREVMQCEYGKPSVFRLSDPEETDVGMKLYGIEGTIADTLLTSLGYHRMKKCLLLGTVDGGKNNGKAINKQIRRICREHGAFNLSPFKVTRIWEKGRFRDPYLREDLQDYGIMIDTLECSVNWSQAGQVHRSVREFVKNRPQTICMTHLSHAYPQGTNLYFIFIAKMKKINEYLELQYGILEAIQKSGAAISHHHGVGKQTAPWLEDQIGDSQMNVIRTLKKHFDPKKIMNPGGTLGLDMSEEQINKTWGMH